MVKHFLIFKNKKFIIILFLILLFFISFFEYYNKNTILPKQGFDSEIQSTDYLSIMAIMKNESMNLKVWIDHYIWQGVDHIYLIDNGSTDNSVDIIKDLQQQGYPISLYIITEKHNQESKYRNIYDLENLPIRTKWLIICDLDEFFYCYNSTIKNELHNYENYSVIYSRWRFFGSENLEKHPEDIRTAIKHRKYELDRQGKYIIQPKNIKSEQLNIHHIERIKREHVIDLSDIFRLNHYNIQSKEFFEKIKLQRGDVNSDYYEKMRNWEYFEKFDKEANFEDNDLRNMILSQ